MLKSIIIVIPLLLALLAPLAMADTQQVSTSEVKSSTITSNATAAIQATSSEIRISQDVIRPVPTGAAAKETKMDNVQFNNYGGNQTIFINSDVTINGTFQNQIQSTEGQKAEQKAAGATPTGPAGTPPQPPKPPEYEKYHKLVDDATKFTGLFTVYTKKDLVFWEISPKQLDSSFIISGALATGLGAGWSKPGMYLGSTVVYFQKADDKIQLMQRNVRFKISDKSAEKDTFDKNFSDSLIASFPIDVTNPQSSAYIVDMKSVLLSDLFQIADVIKSNLGIPFGLDAAASFVKESKVNPENLITRVLFSFRSGGQGSSDVIVDSRNAQIEYFVNIQPLNDNKDFKPREADTRIGHFIEAHKDFSNKTDSESFVRYISRWDIRKASPDAALSAPVKPIVVWLDKAIPEEYRDAVKRGILEWNKAFEKIGIKGAIQVSQQPKDATWDISDTRFNAVQWNTSNDLAYGAVAQWVANPYTGEILNGGFLIEAEVLRGATRLKKFREAEVESQLKAELNPAPALRNTHQLVDEYARLKAEQASFGLTLIAANEGINAVSGEFLKDFVNQYMFALACHEFGHVLGFRHNFKASTLLPLDKLHDKELTKEKSYSSSIMDYTPINFAPPGVKQGFYFEPTIGPYDYLAIEYAYKSIKPATGETEAKALSTIAKLAETHDYKYATDEDLYSGNGVGIDPLNNHFDLSDDPLGYAEQLTDTIAKTIPKLPNLIKEGDDYSDIRYAYNYMLNQYFQTSQFALKYLGGEVVNRVKKGGANEPQPLEPVPANKQRQAINFLINKIFSDELFEASPEIMNKLASEKWMHWGTNFPGPSSEYPVTQVAQNLYSLVLNRVFSAQTIRRILDEEKQQKNESDLFTLPELFETVSGGVWKDVKSYQKRETTNQKPYLSSTTRILQRQHLKCMIQLMLESEPGMAEDARTQAFQTLVYLQTSIKNIVNYTSKADKVDDYTYSHLAESLAKINRALDARLNVPVDSR